MPKIKNKVLLSGGLATVIGIAGCSKYEDGPAFSLLTKKQRLVGEWEITKFEYPNGTSVFNNNITVELEFDDDGDVEMKQTYSSGYYGYGGVYTQSGDWEFSSDKEELELDWDNGYYNWELEITRLTNKELEGEMTVIGYGEFDFEAEKQ